ncbi:thioesterase family protein [Bacteriovorax sp. Seq25_V]|uniref:acyl-CoA thioesterase n=1 Tax=Bacteriovorax sp. Seq25_V TaxID=1201288 RepID=UPI00038A52C3|nr:acyl-CoA thioesterase [Bacteriovorax sp. Seq25_V]EQC48057.1 acyl-CoA thioester hydrolase, YbgC/YbaW family [Bacteriovorax sp. Seq25_V]
METTVHRYEILINEKHLDSFGHVNNAVYLELYEEARWDLITKGGWGLDRIQRDKIGPVITSLKIDFKRELKNREVITIETSFGGFRNSKISYLEQRMLKADGAVANTMTMEAGLFDLRERKLVDPSDEWMRALGVEGDWRNYLK